jgi:hypothetical protein
MKSQAKGDQEPILRLSNLQLQRQHRFREERFCSKEKLILVLKRATLLVAQ